MRIGLVAKHDVPERVEVAREVVKLLNGRAEVIVKDELAAHFPDLKAQALRDMQVDVLATVGGDGTILYAMQQSSAPVFGINTGELGFLTEVEPANLREALDKLLRKEYTVEDRLKLAVRVNGERTPDAVNEAVIKSAHPSKMLALRVASNGELIEDIRADGVILATPTGSTSYSMSAGGPIVDPRIEAFIMVPLAAFKLGARPFVFPARAKVEVALPPEAKDAVLVADGQFERRLAGGDQVDFTGAQQRARFLRFSTHFYGRLRERLVR
ncbi:MAG TPA: NAD(+)/NADH kinase [Candidatus Thermoplasmatota archaeon]|jgi:NAD+ kinase|nr:NAD(+)/NADH kinase [Candidatus Thermoplasmatota archaeon]